MRVDDSWDPDTTISRSTHLRLKMLGYLIEAQATWSPEAQADFTSLARTYEALADRVKRREVSKDA